MVTLEQLNELRQNGDWERIAEEAREHLQKQPNAEYVLRALVQALEKQNRQDDEYENALIRLLAIKDRLLETTRKLAAYYRDKGMDTEAIRHYEIALESAVNERQYKVVEDLWTEFLDIAPDRISFLTRMSDVIHQHKQSQKAAMFMQLALPVTEQAENWKHCVLILERLLDYTPDDESLRQSFVDALKKVHPASSDFDRVIEHTGILRNRPVKEALAELDGLLLFLPGRFVQHPDWGIGKVKDLDMLMNRVKINFQRKRDHQMNLELARKALTQLPDDDFRVMLVTQKEKLETLKEEDPVELVKLVLRSYGYTLNAKQIKDYLVPQLMADRHWTSWWSNTGSALRKDPYISFTGGSTKTVTLRDHAASEEDELLTRFDETKAVSLKVDQLYEYLRTTKRSDLNLEVLRHFSTKLHQIAPRRRKQAERIELWMANDDLKEYHDDIESMPEAIVDDAIVDIDKAVRTLQALRFKTHQSRFAARMVEIIPDDWPTAFRRLLLEPNAQIRDELAARLEEAEQFDVIHSIIDEAISNYRELPHTFIWLADKSLSGQKTWLDGKIGKPQIMERLLFLIDFLTSQAKRRDRDEANWLRKVAGEAREIIRRGNYTLFKQSIAESDEGIAQSIYRRAQANEGLDNRTTTDLTTIIRARHPYIFSTAIEEESIIPEGVLCLPSTLTVKRALLKRLIEIDLPAVVREIETARGHGDLRENAEYHAAKDKQRLLSSQTSELQDMLQQAKAVELSEVDAETIQFGVLFHAKTVGGDVVQEYIMLGPWESDPDNNVLSYLAPLSRFFIGKKVGEEVDVEMPSMTGRFIIDSIERVPSERIGEIEERISPPGIEDLLDQDDEEDVLSQSQESHSELEGTMVSSGVRGS